MGLFLDVVVDITLPVVLIAGFGFALQRGVGFDVASLNRLLVYATLPCFLLHTLSSADLPLAEVEATAVFTVIQFLLLLAIGWMLAGLLARRGEDRPILALAAAFPNSGNFGIPVIELAFGPDYVVHQAVITALLTILILTIAPLFLANRAGGLKGVVQAIFGTPLIPAVAAGLLLNALDVALPRALAQPLQVMGAAYVPVALFGLGVQLASSGWRESGATVAWGVTLRLVAAPLLTTLVLVFLIDLPEGLRDVLIVGSCAPVGVLLAIFCAEYGRGPGLASAMVVLSTVISPLLVTAAIYLTRLY